MAAKLAAVLAEVLKVDIIDPDAHFFTGLGADSLLMAQFCARVRKLPDLPAISIKDIYRHSTIGALAGAVAPDDTAAAAGGVTDRLTAVLAEVLKVDIIDPDAHFFTDLGADSLLMAQFCARVRKLPDLPQISIKDIYRNPSIAALAAAHGPAPASPVDEPTVYLRPVPQPLPRRLQSPADAPMSRSKPRFYLCGLLQLLLFLGTSTLLSFVLASGLKWIYAGPGVLDVYLRSLAYGSALFAGSCLFSILVKWTLIGRWKPAQIPVWSLAYLRFWLVKTLVRTNPLARFVGTPLYTLYLRSLGANIGRGVTILAPSVGVCSDLLTIGSGSIIRKDSFVSGYRAVDGVIQIGPVSLGRDVYIGEMTVLDIGTAMGDGAQLGHSSSLHSGQFIPAGESWHGTPAEPADVDYRMVGTSRLSVFRRIVLPVLQLLFLLTVTGPLLLSGLIMLFRELPQLATLVADLPPTVTTWSFYQDALLVATALYFGGLLLASIVMVTVPRLLRPLVKPGREYRLYGIRYWAHRTITRLTNRRVFTRLYGDSSYIVHYLRSIGYRLRNVEQTGSNFGTDVKHDNPFLSAVGSKTVVADGLSLINADYSSTHFRVSLVSIGAENFLGNRVAYPAQGRTGDNCLLATKVMVPIDGPVREGVGLLGSPSFEIPRTVDRDHQHEVTDPAELRRRLWAKNRHNTLTMLMLLLSRWLLICLLSVVTLATVDLYAQFGWPLVALSGFLAMPLTTGYFLLLDLVFRGLMAYRPNGCSIYDRAFWRHERFWKVVSDTYIQAFNGTPFKNVLWRLLGVKIGRRVFDDGCSFTERRFVTIGDHCTLNAGSIVQCHSQEDGAFKSDRSALGAGCTLGVGAFVHYGVTLHDQVRLEPDSFLMKGSEVPSRARWGGNPAMEIDCPADADPLP